MSIIYNNTEIENITYNGNNIDVVNYNGTEVFSGTKTLTVNKGSYISSIIINGTTYTSNTTLNIKPGTSVTLNCNLNSSSTFDEVTTNYSFYRWTGYTTNTNKSFTFTMPNSNITYTANGTHSSTMNWPSGNIPEATLLKAINNNIYNTSLVGRTVTLTESSSTHNWLIVHVNHGSYYLWYKGSIGQVHWKGSGDDRLWTNNDPTDTTYVRGLCNSYKSKLSSSIQAKLRGYCNYECGYDKVVILSARQLGYTESDYVKDNNFSLSYFDSNTERKTGDTYWTTTARSSNTRYFWVVDYSGSLSNMGPYDYNYYVNPAIRVG